jgi:hypothetical protein
MSRPLKFVEIPDMRVVFTREELAAITRHLVYSFRDMEWDYEQLTDTEKKLVSRETFDAIVSKVRMCGVCDEDGSILSEGDFF